MVESAANGQISQAERPIGQTTHASKKAHLREGEDKWDPQRRCRVIARSTGERCWRLAIKGGDVCAMHGGSLPSVIAAARRRLLAGAEPAVARLLEIVEARPGQCVGCGHVDPATGAKCSGCGRSDDNSTIVSAIRTLLDRCGLGPKVTVEVEEKAEDLGRLSVDDLRARAREILAMADFLEAEGAAVVAEDGPRAIEGQIAD